MMYLLMETANIPDRKWSCKINDDDARMWNSYKLTANTSTEFYKVGNDWTSRLASSTQKTSCTLDKLWLYLIKTTIKEVILMDYLMVLLSFMMKQLLYFLRCDNNIMITFNKRPLPFRVACWNIYRRSNTMSRIFHRVVRGAKMWGFIIAPPGEGYVVHDMVLSTLVCLNVL